MNSLFALLLVGYLGGFSGRVAWIFISSSLVLLCAPVYLICYLDLANPVSIASLTILGITVVQFGSLAGVIESRVGDSR